MLDHMHSPWHRPRTKGSLLIWKERDFILMEASWDMNVDLRMRKKGLDSFIYSFLQIRHWRSGLNPPRFKPFFSMESVNYVMEKDRAHCVCLLLEVFVYHKASTPLLEHTVDTTSPNTQTHNSGTL